MARNKDRDRFPNQSKVEKTNKHVKRLHSVAYFCNLDDKAKRGTDGLHNYEIDPRLNSNSRAKIYDYDANNYRLNVKTKKHYRGHDASNNKQLRRDNTTSRYLRIKQHSEGIGGRNSEKSRVASALTKSFLGLMFGLMILLIVNQLIKLQIHSHDEMKKLAARQQFALNADVPVRGDILDSSGNRLAGTATVYRIGVTPEHVKSIDRSVSFAQIVEKIGETIEVAPVEVEKIIKENNDATYVQLKEGVSAEKAVALRDWQADNYVGGIRLDAEPSRYYNNGTLASPVIGYAARNGSKLEGMLGLEASYDDVLSGRNGYTYAQRNNFLSHGLLPFATQTRTPVDQGLSIKSTLNLDIQKILQRELRLTAIGYKITGNATGVVMNPHTGDVLAMAQYPFFESNDITKSPPDYNGAKWDFNDKETQTYLNGTIFRNHCVSDTYEPGSTFKAITTAIAFEENVTKENDIYLDRPITVMGHEINCWLRGGHGEETVDEAFWRSCNPVFVKISQKTGISTFYKYVRGFGFLEPTGIDLPAEASGIFHKEPTEIDMATLSFGESSAVTPIAMIRSFATLVNGGYLVKPRLVSAYVDHEGNDVQVLAPERGEQVVSSATSKRLAELMRHVITKNVGSFGSEGYDMGGKTSTATEEHSGLLTLSFCGSAPMANPELTCIIIMEKPDLPEMTSQITSRPVQRVLSSALEILGTKRNIDNAGKTSLKRQITVPNLVGLTYQEALRKLLTDELTVGDDVTLCGTDKIAFQIPAPGTKLGVGSAVFLNKDVPAQVPTAKVPDFKGLTLHQSIEKAHQANLNVAVVSGSVAGICQANAKDTPAETTIGTVIELDFSETP